MSRKRFVDNNNGLHGGWRFNASQKVAERFDLSRSQMWTRTAACRFDLVGIKTFQGGNDREGVKIAELY